LAGFPESLIKMTLVGPEIVRPPLRARTWWAMVAIVLALCATGCVQRRMTIRSNPPGALVYVDDYLIGTTPVSADFTYYGTRKIRLVKDRCETLTVMQKFPTPWYQIVPLDFVSENLVPGDIINRHVLDYQLRPQMEVPTEQLQARAEELRRRTHGSAGVPIAPVSVSPPPPVIPSGGVPPSSPLPSSPGPTMPDMLTPPGIGGQPVRAVQP
jgi:hypothetical protein